MKIQETTDRGEKLIEIGIETEEKRSSIQVSLQGAQSRLAQARLALERASETDDEGNPVGDVDYAQAEVSAAMMDVEYYEGQLEATESELERIRAEKLEIVRALDEYFEGEQHNVDVLGKLQGKSFGGNVAGMMAAIISRMNLAESTKAAILNSLGDGYSARNISSAGGGGAGANLTVAQRQEIADNAARSYNRTMKPYEKGVSKGIKGLIQTPNGGVSFAKTGKIYVHQGQPAIVRIEATGNRENDFAEANRQMELRRKPTGYTWHHVDDYDVETNTLTLELVESETHKAVVPHAGSCAQYDAVHGPSYN